MLAIVLVILKGIAWLLLGIILVLFFLVALILASPLRYNLVGEKEEDIKGEFSFSWLFGIIRLWGIYQEEKLNAHATVFGISLLDRKKKKKKKRKKKKASSKKARPQRPKELAVAEKKEEVSKEKVQQKVAHKEERVLTEKIEHKTPAKRMKVSDIQEEEPKPSKEEKAAEKAARKEEKKQERAEKKEVFGEKKEAFLKYWALFQSIEDKKKIFVSGKKLLKRLIKGILPKDVFIKGTVGLGEPELTGYVLALAGILVGKFGNHIAIKGDFTKFVIEDIRLQIRGRIVFGYLVYALLAFVLTRPVRRLIGKIRKGLVEENG